MKTALFPLLLVLSVASAQSPEELIRSVLNRQVEAWNEGNIEEYMKGYWNSDETAFVSEGTVLRGYRQVLERYKKRYATREDMGTLAFEEFRIRLFSERAAVVTGVWRLKRSSDAPWGRFTLIVERKTEGWRIVYDHTSSASP